MKRTFKLNKRTGKLVDVTPTAVKALLPKRRRRIKTSSRRPATTSNRIVHRPKWPILSDAMGVSESQIAEATAKARKMGVNTEYTPDGRAILTSQRHRRDHARAFGFYDRNASYGDMAPQNR